MNHENSQVNTIDGEYYQTGQWLTGGAEFGRYEVTAAPYRLGDDGESCWCCEECGLVIDEPDEGCTDIDCINYIEEG